MPLLDALPIKAETGTNVTLRPGTAQLKESLSTDDLLMKKNFKG